MPLERRPCAVRRDGVANEGHVLLQLLVFGERVGCQNTRGDHAPDVGILLITHYERILRYVRPDFVHVLVDGRIVRTGGRELAAELEQKGYDFVREELYKEPSADAAAGRDEKQQPAGVAK